MWVGMGRRFVTSSFSTDQSRMGGRDSLLLNEDKLVVVSECLEPIVLGAVCVKNWPLLRDTDVAQKEMKNRSLFLLYSQGGLQACSDYGRGFPIAGNAFP